jgi:hypothetical protein
MRGTLKGHAELSIIGANIFANCCAQKNPDRYAAAICIRARPDVRCSDIL